MQGVFNANKCVCFNVISREEKGFMAQKKNLCELSDEEVVLLAQNNDREALDHIITRYRNFVYAKA